jgi:3-hydroxybutyryl-CoA dehydrogenase
MTNKLASDSTVLVVGAGIMGAGIAQVAAMAGHPVGLFDMREGAAAEAIRQLGVSLDKLAAKGKLKPDAVQTTLARLRPVTALAQAQDASLVVEAIVEDRDVKRALFKQLEAVVADDCILATNTSSISVTALANGLRHPGRCVGMHFFNPVPLMKLVEVVSGLQTHAAVAQSIFELAQSWGKVPVHARSTPGFIVNRIARPFYAETLALLLERSAEPQVLDACLRAAGFRMGPCELMDLIGHDTNLAVTTSVFEANYYDKRFTPSLVQRELVDGGLLGRKTGMGFYRYPDGAPALPAIVQADLTATQSVVVHGHGELADQWANRLSKLLGQAPSRHLDSERLGLSVDGQQLVLTDGRCAAEVAAATHCPDVVVFDRLPAAEPTDGAARTLAYACAPRTNEQWRVQARAWLAALGFAPVLVADTPGLVVARTLAMLINEAADAVQQGVCSEASADAAMKLGVNYPAGPFEWLSTWDTAAVVSVLDALDAHHRGERYRASPWLRHRAADQS